MGDGPVSIYHLQLRDLIIQTCRPHLMLKGVDKDNELLRFFPYADETGLGGLVDTQLKMSNQFALAGEYFKRFQQSKFCGDKLVDECITLSNYHNALVKAVKEKIYPVDFEEIKWN